MQPPNDMTGINNPFFGKKHTLESRKKMSESLKGRPAHNKGKSMGEEQKRKLSEMRKGDKNPNFGKSTQKGIKRSPEICKKISEGHKGIPCSEDKRKKISESNKGKTVSNETRIKMSVSAIKRGAPKITKESYKKVSAALKGRKHSPEHCRKNGDAHRGLKQSDEAKKKISIAGIGKQLGEKHWNWQGGISRYPYCYKFNERRKKACRDFFGGFCICTGEHESEMLKKPSVHHIYHDKDEGCNGLPFNLVPLNARHHSREQYYQREYQDYINKTLREGFKWGIWNEQEYIEKVMYDE